MAVASKAKTKPVKKRPLVTYSDAVKGRKKIEKQQTTAHKRRYLVSFTEEMLVGMVEYGVVLDGFSSGIVKELILAWDDAGMITTKHGKAIAKKIREGKNTKRKTVIEKKKRRK